MKKALLVFGLMTACLLVGQVAAQAPSVPAAPVVAAPAVAPVAVPAVAPVVAAPETPVVDAPKVDLAVDPALAATEEPSTSSQLQEQAKYVVSQWETFGWIAGVVALIGLLMMLLRFSALDKWLEAKGLKKFKPYIAMVLGALSGFFTSFATGIGWLQSIVAGIILGLAAVGTHQAVTVGNKKPA